MIFHDELSPNFIQQKGASIDICLGGSGLGPGLYLQPYDEEENELDGASVFIQSKKKAIEMRDLLTEIIESGELIEDEPTQSARLGKGEINLDKKTINQILDYVQRSVEADDREDWSGRDFDQILKDGDVQLVPSFYFQLAQMVK